MVGFTTIENKNVNEFNEEVSEFLSTLKGHYEITFHPLMNEQERFILFVAHIIY